MHKHSRLYLKILCCFLTMVFLIAAVGIVSYFGFVRQREFDFLQHMHSNMEAVHADFSSRLNTVSAIQGLFFSEKIVNNNLVRYEDQSAENKRQLKTVTGYLSDYLSVLDDNILVDICVFLDDVKVYNSQGSNDFDRFFESKYRFEDYDGNFWLRCLSQKAGMEILDATCLTRYGSISNHVLPIVFKNYNNGHMTVFVAVLSVDKLIDEYYDSSVFAESEYVVVDAQGHVLSSRPDLNHVEISALEESAHQQNIRLAGQNYAVVQADYGVFGWRVYCITPMNTLMQINAFYLFLTTSLCVGFGLLALALSYVYSHVIYKPIVGVCQNIDQVFGTELGLKRDELKYIACRLDDIAQRTSDTRQQYTTLIRQYLELCFMRVLNGEYVEDEARLIQVLHDAYGFSSGRYGCLLFDDDASVREAVEQKFSGTLVMRHPSGIQICIYDTLAQGNDGIIEWVRDRLSIEKRFGSGGDCVALTELPMLFEAAADKLIHRTITKWETPFDAAGLTRAIRNRDDVQALKCIQELARKLDCEWPGYRMACEAVNSVHEAVERGLGNEIYQQCDALKQMAHNGVTVLLTWNADIEKQLGCFVCSAIELVPVRERSMRNYEMAQRIKAFIEQHYFEELSLDILAEHMGITGKYTSKIFKDELNVNISDYIAIVRIEHAKGLIREGIPIGAVSTQVGIDSKATFIRVFKKIEGCTPSEYREAHR